MKLKPLTILSIVILIGIGLFYLSNKIAPSKQATVVEQPTPFPVSSKTPDRELKSNEKFIAPVGLYISVPDGMSFRQETADDIKRTGFYIENNDLSFQLYGVYEGNRTITDEGFAKTKAEIDASTLKDLTLGNYKGFQGLITGPKTRYVYVIYKDGKPITLTIVPPTPENQEISDRILSTISFQ